MPLTMPEVKLMPPKLEIDGRIVGGDAAYVIAEIGHNHQGKLQAAKELFLAAKECGADAVKLQKRDNRYLYTREMFMQPYSHENSFGATYGEHREFLEFGRDQYAELVAYAREIGITFFATAFDQRSADFLAAFDMPAYKIASGDLNNIPLIEHVARIGRPVILSTGGATIEDVDRAYESILPINSQVCLLQCTSGYPCAFDELNLRVINTFQERYRRAVVGLSGHDNGIAMAVAAYVLGARVFEKHFTLNRALKGTDHAFSLERPGLSRLVRDLRRVEVAMGDGVKRAYESEKAPLYKMGKKVVAARDLLEGQLLTSEDLVAKSPNDGLPPYVMPQLVGKRLRRSISSDEALSWSDVAPA